MEAVFFILVGGALFSQSWNLLGLLAEARSLGILVAGLALMSLIALIIDPMVLESPHVGANFYHHVIKYNANDQNKMPEPLQKSQKAINIVT